MNMIRDGCVMPVNIKNMWYIKKKFSLNVPPAKWMTVFVFDIGSHNPNTCNEPLL